MNVLSLFDGISCCHLALSKAGVEVNKYYASEIDKYATKISETNYPDAVRLGDVNNWLDWDIDWSSIDIVTGGFPCQAWSMAGKQLGDRDERGKLFWVMLDIIKMVLLHNPKAHFLIENVKMKKEFEEYITLHTTEALGVVYKILINSALVSAQNRNRYYWTSFPTTQPDDKNQFLWDIIEHGFVDRDKAHCIDANYFKGGNLKSYFEKHRRQLVFAGAMRGRYVVSGVRQDSKMLTKGLTKQRLEIRYDGKTNALTTVTKDNQVVDRPDGRPYYDLSEITYRKLTPLECERLQCVPEGYTSSVSNTQRYRALGNGWTVDVIAHLFKDMKNEITHLSNIVLEESSGGVC